MLRIYLAFTTLFATQIELGNKLIEIEIADTNISRSKGLSGRTDLPEGEGMLFVYESPTIGQFWMKDTLIPLSLGFFDEQKTLIQWVDMLPSTSPPHPIYKSQKPVTFALEVPLGWFRRNKMQPGMKFSWVDEKK